MNRLFTSFGCIGALVLPVAFACVLFDDLGQPERWDRDWTHDPRLYVPFACVGVGLPLLLLVRELRRPRLAVRLRRLNAEAESLRSAGRHAEADRALDEFKRLWERQGLGKTRPLS